MISEEKILRAKILIVDDQDLSIRLLTEIFKKAGYSNITSTNNSREAKDFYQHIRPDLVVLDLNMPEVDGFEVMTQLQKIEGDNYLPILVLSNEENQAIRLKALESGAKDFLNKPYDRVEVIKRIHNLIEVRMLNNEVRNQNKILEEKVKERTKELYDTQLDVIQRLARAVEYRDLETGMHIVRMSYYCASLAEKVGFNLEECEMILRASPLHDIGKIGIPDSILLKPGKLTPEEFAIMKTHTLIGGELLSSSSSKFMYMAREIALTHHEKWNGSGYPYGLKETEIPTIGRICCVCDVFDALLTKRPYKRAWTLEETIQEIERGNGTLFDPDMVEAFLKIMPQIREISQKYIDPEN